MENIYQLLDTLLPFAWLDHNFMKNAFLAVILVTPLFGLLSTMVVSNRMAFFADSLGHGAFTGIAIGVLLGSMSPLLSLIVFSVVFAVVITYIKEKSNAAADTIIGVFSSMAVAVGLMMMSYGGGFNKFSSYLIGDVLSITPEDLGALLTAVVLIYLIWGIIFNDLLVISINPIFARSRGIKVFWMESFFAAAVAVVVAVSIQWVGLLIINSLLVLPAAAARNMTNNVKQYHAVSIGIALFAGISGLMAAYYFNMAAGATIVVIAAALFFVSLCCKRYFVR